MNKYQEAFRLFGKSIEKTMDNFTMDELIGLKEADKALAELVDRATPKKFDINKINTRYDYSQEKYETIIPCPNCGSDILLGNGFKFCPHCGQALDWEKEGK